MSFTFEVRDSDLLGRLGRIEAGGKTLDTPCLLPVIHPVNQSVSTAELKAMGFEGLMTNSYILHSRRHDESLSEGIHRLLDYDGVFITDSGGYQVLRYGELEVGYREIADFQSKIGSELAVTLDRPTGYPQPKGYARETMEYSLRNAVATRREYGKAGTAWVGPVQGGLFTDLLTRSARALSAAGFEFLALGSPVQVMQNYMFSDLARMIIAVKKAVPYSTPLHLFGAGHPLTMALAVALGCDTFDSASYILFARRGKYMTPRGVSALEQMKFLPCSCPVCVKTSVAGLLELEALERSKNLALHNLFVLRGEVEACKEAIAEGRLWDLVEEKAVVHPRVQEAFLQISKRPELLSPGTPATKDRGVMLRSLADLYRPEFWNARERVRRTAFRSKDRAALLPWKSTLNPGSGKGSKRRASKAEDLYRIHPAIGVFPAELDFVYPFTQTVFADEQPLADTKAAAKILRSMGYKSVRVATLEVVRSVGKRAKSRQKQTDPSPSLRSSSTPPR